MSAPPTYYWQKHRRFVSNGRMVWYAESSDQKFWYEHWKSRLSTRYYKFAENYDFTSSDIGRILLSELSSDGLHLEAGCGAGFWVAALGSRGFKVEGIEYSRELVKLVKRIKPELPICWGDALAIARSDNYYNSFLSFGVVEHRVEGPGPFLSEAFRVLKPGGKIIISVPFFGPIRKIKAKLNFYEKGQSTEPFFQYAFSKQEFMSLLYTAGFLIKSVYALSPHRLLIEEIPLYRWLSFQKGNRFSKKVAEKLLKGKDGHMLLVIGQKSEV